ncbi:MAG: dihydrolipoamide acetyltransferase family protein [Candidatus Latescibacterota bacterium]|jgi:pyruvate dehydrogenase E2 component (dihydrolipoamide acetyltransferase)
MAIEITLPRLGWSMDEGVFVQWLKQDGEQVKAGEPLFSLETEKAVQEVEATDSGLLCIPPGSPAEGDMIPVGQVLGYLLAAGEEPPAGPLPVRPAAEPSEAEGAPAAGGTTATEPVALGPAPTIRPTVPVSPRAARLAAELSVDLAVVTGSGRSGRIRERDVRAAATAGGGSPVVPADGRRFTASPDREVPVSTARRMIAEKMMQSQTATAAVTLMVQADATHLVSLRTQLKALATDGEPLPSFTDILIKLVAVALAEHPQLNSRWTGERIVLCGGIHVGVAVDTEAGLVVPVIRDVPGLTLREVAARSRDLIDRARSRRLASEEMGGGTFTVSNLGPMGIDAFTPIINAPECAILGVGRITRQAAVVGDAVVPRDRLWLSLTFDHRIVDGGPAARFLERVRVLVENPGARLIP